MKGEFSLEDSRLFQLLGTQMTLNEFAIESAMVLRAVPGIDVTEVLLQVSDGVPEHKIVLNKHVGWGLGYFDTSSTYYKKHFLLTSGQLVSELVNETGRKRFNDPKHYYVHEYSTADITDIGMCHDIALSIKMLLISKDQLSESLSKIHHNITH